jgi:hypothetical protein
VTASALHPKSLELRGLSLLRVIPSEGVSLFPIRGPKWPREHSPGFTLGNSPTRISPEGAAGCGENRLRTFEPDRLRMDDPFRAKRLFWLTQGKPWAKLSCPFGAGPSGHMTGPRHLRFVRSPRNLGDGALTAEAAGARLFLVALTFRIFCLTSSPELILIARRGCMLGAGLPGQSDIVD